MSRARTGGNYYIPGTTNTIDDITGFKEKLSSQRRLWNGFFTVNSQWNPRQMQDFAAPIKPELIAPNVRPVPLLVESFPPLIIY